MVERENRPPVTPAVSTIAHSSVAAPKASTHTRTSSHPEQPHLKYIALTPQACSMSTTELVLEPDLWPDLVVVRIGRGSTTPCLLSICLSVRGRASNRPLYIQERPPGHVRDMEVALTHGCQRVAAAEPATLATPLNDACTCAHSSSLDQPCFQGLQPSSRSVPGQGRRRVVVHGGMT